MEGLELACFQIISEAGVAKSNYIEAMKEGRNGNFQKAKDCIKDGESAFMQGHNVHAELIQKEISGEQVIANLLLVHAEDQLMSAETCKIFADELIRTYERITFLENK
jgi:PTS system cellobiose-specific IIA component